MEFKGYGLALITDEKQRQYFLGFHSTAGYVMLTPDKTTFVVDSRYILAAKKALCPKGIEVVLGADFTPLKERIESQIKSLRRKVLYAILGSLSLSGLVSYLIVTLLN